MESTRRVERLNAALRRAMRAPSSTLAPTAKGPVEQLKMSAAEGCVKVRPEPKSRSEEESTVPGTVPQVACVSMERGEEAYCVQTWET